MTERSDQIYTTSNIDGRNSKLNTRFLLPKKSTVVRIPKIIQKGIDDFEANSNAWFDSLSTKNKSFGNPLVSPPLKVINSNESTLIDQDDYLKPCSDTGENHVFFMTPSFEARESSDTFSGVSYESNNPYGLFIEPPVKKEEAFRLEPNTLDSVGGSHYFSSNESLFLKIYTQIYSEKTSKDWNKTFIRLILLINEVTPQNYSEVLIEVVRALPQEMSLNEVFSMVYKPFIPDSNLDDSGTALKVEDFQNMTAREAGIKICSFILAAFRPITRATASILFNPMGDVQPVSVNFDEFRRAFISIKILLSSVVKVDAAMSSHNSIPRMLLYDVYCAIFQGLLKDGACGFYFRNHKNYIMGPSQLGRIINLAFPDLKLRRLGRRGNSKYHYMGLAWNKTNIPPEIFRRLGLESQTPTGTFLRTNGQPKMKKFLPLEEQFKGSTGMGQGNKSLFNAFCDGWGDSRYSYVDSSTKIPEFEDSFKVWNFGTDKNSQKSNWSSRVISRSVEALKKYKIDMQPVVENLQSELLKSGGSDTIIANYVANMCALSTYNSSQEAYMHLHLIMLLLIFPVVLASDAELSQAAKFELRKNLTSFMNCLNCEASVLANSEANQISNMMHIIRKMIHINKMTSSQIRTSLTKNIIKSILCEFQKQNVSSESFEGVSCEDIIYRAVFMVSKAHSLRFSLENSEFSPKVSVEIIKKIAKCFSKFAFTATESLGEVLKSLYLHGLKQETFDLPFQIFRVSVRTFQEICLSDPLISKLPIQIIRHILLQINKDMQGESFKKFSQRDNDVSKETFKTWWVHSTLSEEYMYIFSEIIALGSRLT